MVDQKLAMSQEHAAARNFNAIAGCTNRGFISGKECNFSAPHSTAEDLSGVQMCKNNGKIPKESNTISESFRKQTDEKQLSRIFLLPSRIQGLEEGQDNRPVINKNTIKRETEANCFPWP